MPKPDYDTTLARIAGNIAAGLVRHPHMSGVLYEESRELVADYAIDIARRIVEKLRPVPREGAPQEP